MTDHATTKQLIEARTTAAEIIALIESECTSAEGTAKPLAFTRRLWSIIQHKSIDQIGIPRAAAVEIEPMNDRQAEKFAEVTIPFGVFIGMTIGQLQRTRPEYLANIADGTAFTKTLKRYLARTKYASDDSDNTDEAQP